MRASAWQQPSLAIGCTAHSNCKLHHQLGFPSARFASNLRCGRRGGAAGAAVAFLNSQEWRRLARLSCRAHLCKPACAQATAKGFVDRRAPACEEARRAEGGRPDSGGHAAWPITLHLGTQRARRPTGPRVCHSWLAPPVRSATTGRWRGAPTASLSPRVRRARVGRVGTQRAGSCASLLCDPTLSSTHSNGSCSRLQCRTHDP